jgi:hypothetical protein
MSTGTETRLDTTNTLLAIQLVLILIGLAVFLVDNLTMKDGFVQDLSAGALGFQTVNGQLGVSPNPYTAEGFSNSRISGMAGIDQGPSFWGPTNYDEGDWSVAASQGQNYYKVNSPYTGEVMGENYTYTTGSPKVNPVVWNDKLANMEGMKNTRISGNAGLRVSRRSGLENKPGLGQMYYSSPNEGAVVASKMTSVDNDGNAVIVPLVPY